MQDFTLQRDAQAEDELWVVQHPPVYTQGLNGKAEHILNAADIPVVQSDRGGQVTYHGPGQVVAYPLINIQRANLGIRQLISCLENAVIELLSHYNLEAHARKDAPGVYLESAKIASLGLRIKRGCSYHGLSLNVHMDLSPFARINPCGYAGLRVTQLYDRRPCRTAAVSCRLVRLLAKHLNYAHTYYIAEYAYLPDLWQNDPGDSEDRLALASI